MLNKGFGKKEAKSAQKRQHKLTLSSSTFVSKIVVAAIPSNCNHSNMTDHNNQAFECEAEFFAVQCSKACLHFLFFGSICNTEHL